MPRPKKTFLCGCLLGFGLGVVFLVLSTVTVVFGFKDLFIRHMATRLRVPPITTGLKADYDWRVSLLGGGTLDMAQTRGKTVFLNFWGINCPMCLAELPSINRLYEQVEGAGVVFICVVVSKDKSDGKNGIDSGELRFILDEYDVRFPVYLMAGPYPSFYDGHPTPVTFIIAPNGDIAFKHEGGARWEDESTVAFLKSLSESSAFPATS